VQKFESTYSLHNVPVPIRQRNARSAENIAAVQRSVEEDPNQSIPRRSQELGISSTSLWRILRKDLGLHPYKIVLTQELKPHDHQMRRKFSNWSNDQFEKDPNFHRKIILSDETYFRINGFVNKQNCCICSTANPEVFHQTPIHLQK